MVPISLYVMRIYTFWDKNGDNHSYYDTDLGSNETLALECYEDYKKTYPNGRIFMFKKSFEIVRDSLTSS